MREKLLFDSKKLIIVNISMKISSLLVHIENGKIVPKSEAHEDLMRRFLSQWDGKIVRLEISTTKSKRSDQQNRYYWFYLSLVSEDTGEDKDTLHSYFKNKFLSRGIKEVYGDKVRVSKSTTDLTKGEFCDYLVEIANLTEIALPDTTAHWGYSYHK